MARRAGFRLDWEPDRANDTLTIQGDYHLVDGDEYFTRPQLTPPFSRTLNAIFESQGANLLGRWTRSFSSTSSLSVQAYYADSLYEDGDSGIHDHLADVEVQHRFRPAPRHDVVWGGGYRRRENVFAQQSRGIRWDEPVQRRYLQTAHEEVLPQSTAIGRYPRNECGMFRRVVVSSPSPTAVPAFLRDFDPSCPRDARARDDVGESRPACAKIRDAMRQESTAPSSIVIHPLTGLPEIQPGDDLVALIVAALARARLTIATGDVLVVTQKIVSKAEDRLVALDSVVPSAEARQWAEAWAKDARVVELVLREAARIVKMERGLIIAETRHGLVCANAGVDTSNVRPGWAALMPIDPDGAARRLCAGVRAATGARIGVIVSDTFGRPWREGQTNVAIGVAGLRPIADYRGCTDTFGQRLVTSAIAVADELAAAAELVMGKTSGCPVALIAGCGIGSGDDEQGSVAELLRRREDDLFR